MGNPFGKFGMSDDEFRAAVLGAAEVDAGINEFMKEELVPYWKNHPDTPVDSGAYAASIKVVKKARRGKGGKVRATDYKAAWIEFGTGEPGATTAHGVGQKVAEHFGGNLNGGIDVESE